MINGVIKMDLIQVKLGQGNMTVIDVVENRGDLHSIWGLSERYDDTMILSQRPDLISHYRQIQLLM